MAYDFNEELEKVAGKSIDNMALETIECACCKEPATVFVDEIEAILTRFGWILEDDEWICPTCNDPENIY